MNSHEPENDPLECMLSGTPGESSDELREIIRKKTLAVLRRRRWTRRAVWVSGLAGCYAAGILTMAIRLSAESPSAVSSTPQPEPNGQLAPTQSTPETVTPKSAQQPETALTLEWQALDSEERQPDLFRLAGDKYLLANDLQSATRCYKGALQGASDEELHITINDNWLFMSLKEAKLEENRYAKLVSP